MKGPLVEVVDISANNYSLPESSLVVNYPSKPMVTFLRIIIYDTQWNIALDLDSGQWTASEGLGLVME